VDMTIAAATKAIAAATPILPFTTDPSKLLD
jgi:hypothetical protein